MRLNLVSDFDFSSRSIIVSLSSDDSDCEPSRTAVVVGMAELAVAYLVIAKSRMIVLSLFIVWCEMWEAKIDSTCAVCEWPIELVGRN